MYGQANFQSQSNHGSSGLNMTSKMRRGQGQSGSEGSARLLRILGTFLVVLAFSASGLSRAGAQEVTVDDYLKLRINEIIADNDDVEPRNWRCRTVDMVEIYNGSDKVLPLGVPSDPDFGWVRLTDGSLDIQNRVRYLDFTGLGVRSLLPGQRLVVFCDERPFEGSDSEDSRTADCAAEREGIDLFEVHAPFRLDNDGEVLTLEFLPGDGSDPIPIHQVEYPPLNRDVSYARFPEDIENLDGFVFTKLPTLSNPDRQGPTFGQCAPPGVAGQAACLGGANNSGDPISPNIEMIDYSTNSPAPGAEVRFRVRVTDEFTPDEANITAVAVHYRVDGGDFQSAPFTFVDLLEDADNPVEKWSIWEGAIPASANQLGSTVEFYFEATDRDDQSDTEPETPICDLGIGPCDEDDTQAEIDAAGDGCVLGQECSQSFQYTVTEPSEFSLVMNEVVPSNDSILADPTESATDCSVTNPTCNFDDFLELANTQALNLQINGLVLARGPFRPSRGWVFGAGSRIGPRERLIVWVDGDGVDPDPLADPPDPPNPNNFAQKEYHTDFTLDAESDEIFLFEPLGNHEYRLITGVRWGTSGRYFEDRELGTVVDPLPLPRHEGVRDQVSGVDETGQPVELGLVRFPDGDPLGSWSVRPAAQVTPTLPNVPGENAFRRGDSNGDGGIDITDPITNLQFQFLGVGQALCRDAMDFDDNGKLEITDPILNLQHLFLGIGQPAPPGATCGSDPTEDALPECDYVNC